VEVGGEVGHELVHHDEGARRGLGEGEAVHHLFGREPPVVVHGLLADIPQHGVCTAERHDRSLAEKDSDFDEDVLTASP
jgi:hypothetical protein